MQFFYWLVFLLAIGIAIFAVQNSAAPLITIKFLIWKFETSLVYTILGSIVLGIILHPSFLDPKGLTEHPSGRKSPIRRSLRPHHRLSDEDHREETIVMKGLKLFRVLGIQISLNYTWFIVFGLIAWSLARGYFPLQLP